MSDYAQRRPWRRIPGGEEIRHMFAPPPMACRWCGVETRSHGQRWVRGHSWHQWTPPTPAQVHARLWCRMTGGGLVGGGRHDVYRPMRGKNFRPPPSVIVARG